MRPFPNSLFSHRAEPTIFHMISTSFLINSAVLLSMTLQVVLACGGAFRHSSSNVILQFILWLAYMSSDAVAIYGLGNMAQQTRPGLYGIFAPLLLLHLGGPDTISAYSTADNELWTRHMVTMMFQISVAMFVIYVSGLKEGLLAAAILILFVGSTKYAERTVALRSGSVSRIVSSAMPTYYRYMNRDEGRSCRYPVILKEKKQVNVDDVWKAEGMQVTDNYMLCLSHALFKMYKRRYGILHLFEKHQKNTRRFFLGEQNDDMKIPPLTDDKVFPVIEIELKFLYDALFTKSSGTAYSKLGVFMRLLNIVILGIAGFIIFNELGKKHDFFDGALSAQMTVTYILVAVALLVEFSQLLRIITSDWTLVWLICTNIHAENKEKQKPMERWVSKLFKLATRVLSCVREKCLKRYWKKTIPQYCIVDACSNISPLIWKWSGYFHVRDLIIRWYIETPPIEDDFRKFVVEQVKDKCPAEEDDIESFCKNIRCFWSTLVGENRNTGLLSFGDMDQEHLILHWHVATTICEMEYNMDDSEDEGGKRYFNLSKKLSRYCAYLLVWRTKLLDLHPDIAKVEYMLVHTDLIAYNHSKPKTTLNDIARNPDMIFKGSSFHGGTENNWRLWEVMARNPDIEGSSFRGGVELANMLFEIGTENKRRLWEVIAGHWAEVLIFNATRLKHTTHTEYLAAGGEFLTHLWVLIGHMGAGDQS